ncbi:MAG TPA: adenylate/guanylate cyclase domain-containing protein [Methylomirabilota bacterium]|nr:adenylate/guanylate cyclase domain-containing protein [Methylomirabilota bacterium]
MTSLPPAPGPPARSAPAAEARPSGAAPGRTPRVRLLRTVLLALAVAGLLTAAFLLDTVAAARARAVDLLLLARPVRPPTATVIVGVDERSAQRLRPRYGPVATWPRSLYAQALEALRAASPRLVGLAVLFDAPGADDEELATALRRAANVITPVVAQGARAFDPRPGIAQDFDRFVRPTRAVRDARLDEGIVNVTAARDGVVRSLPLVLQAGEEQVPSFALVVVARYTRRERVIDAMPPGGPVFAAGRAIPVAERDSMLINFLGPPSDPGGNGPFRIIPLVDVLEGAFDPQWVQDKIVLVGFTTPGVDEHPTPTTGDRRMWGVEILGSAIETLLHQRFLVSAPRPAVVALIFALALLAGLLAAGRRPLGMGLLVLGMLGLYLIAASLLLEAGVILDLVLPPAALLLTFAVALVDRVVFEQAEQRRIREAMARYLSPSVSRWVLADPRRLRLGGELREMTILFGDLRNFTTHAHALPPETLVALLNDHMTEMTAIVFRHDGVLAHYAGDGLEAFWNAPMTQPDHARRACEAALEMIAALGALRREFAAHGWGELDMGIGLNTGSAIVGNLGSRDRLAYTAVGDPVNVASRLEGLSKEYGVHIVIGDATRQAAGEAFEYRFLDLVAVKGRAEPVQVYELVGRAGSLSPERREVLARYERGVALYRHRRWAEAEALFEELAGTAPDDGPVALYRRRARELLERPPASDWDGVWVAKTK